MQNLIYKEKDPIARRLACYTFTKLIKALKERVKKGQRDAFIVRNICLKFLAGISNQKTAKLQLAKHII